MRLYPRRLGLLSLLCALAPLCAAAAVSGEAVYKARCALCHDSDSPNYPSRETLKRLPAARILRVLTSGEMMSIASALSKDEREAVASFLGTSAPAFTLPPQAYCRDRSVKVADASRFVWNRWSPGVTNMRYQSGEAAGLSIDQARRLKLKWAFGFDADLAAFSQPAVFGSQVFVGSSAGNVYALRAETGCVQWIFEAGAPVRSAMLVTPVGNRHALLFGDQSGWFYAIEAESGRLLWKHRLDEHDAARVTGSPVAGDGIVYVPLSSWEETSATRPTYACCTFRGSVVALRIRDGKVIWKTFTIEQEPTLVATSADGREHWGPSGAGVWSAPAIDRKRGLLYATTGNNYSPPETATSDAVVAMDLAKGGIVWSRQLTPRDIFSGCAGEGCGPRGPDFDFGSSAMLIASAEGRELVVAGQKSGVVYALDPDRRGEVVWQTRTGKGSAHGGVQWGMASDGRNVYAPTADGDYVRVANNRVLDPNDGGGLTALRVADGSVAWHAAPARACGAVPGCSPAQLAAVTAIPGVVFSGAMDGHLRAYSSEDGQVLWDFDTSRAFSTVNGVKANGGALNGPGAVVVNGMVLVNSGYDHFGSMTGNVLLAFAPEGQ